MNNLIAITHSLSFFVPIQVQALFHMDQGFLLRNGSYSLAKVTKNYPSRKGVKCIHTFVSISICQKHSPLYFLPCLLSQKSFTGYIYKRENI